MQPTSTKEMNGFAEGLIRNWQEVSAAVGMPWSNGRTEGHVNRLKLIKRKMYGRAKLDLLRIRVLGSGL
jgi:transposase